MDDFITCTTTVTTITTGATSTSVAIPNASSGVAPLYVRVAATQACYVKLGVTAPTATTNDILVQPADAVVLQIPRGIAFIAAIQDTTGGKCNIVPLEG